MFVPDKAHEEEEPAIVKELLSMFFSLLLSHPEVDDNLTIDKEAIP